MYIKGGSVILLILIDLTMRWYLACLFVVHVCLLQCDQFEARACYPQNAPIQVLVPSGYTVTTNQTPMQTDDSSQPSSSTCSCGNVNAQYVGSLSNPFIQGNAVRLIIPISNVPRRTNIIIDMRKPNSTAPVNQTVVVESEVELEIPFNGSFIETNATAIATIDLSNDNVTTTTIAVAEYIPNNSTGDDTISTGSMSTASNKPLPPTTTPPSTPPPTTPPSTPPTTPPTTSPSNPPSDTSSSSKAAAEAAADADSSTTPDSPPSDLSSSSEAAAEAAADAASSTTPPSSSDDTTPATPPTTSDDTTPPPTTSDDTTPPATTPPATTPPASTPPATTPPATTPTTSDTTPPSTSPTTPDTPPSDSSSSSADAAAAAAAAAGSPTTSDTTPPATSSTPPSDSSSSSTAEADADAAASS